MKVPFYLRRLPQALPATAVLLPSHRAEEMLRLCVRLGCDPDAPLYAVADGLLLKLPRATSEPIPGAIRLRSLVNNLLLPVDAELVPTLLDDEAADLVRRRGLIFLPGGRILEFAPDKPLPIWSLLGSVEMKRMPWKPLPVVQHLAERITEMMLAQPDESPEELLDAGQEEIGTEEPRPDDASLPKTAAAKATFAAGKGMAWLGKMLNIRALARAGANWMAGALEMAPRLSEGLLGLQEAALRQLLKDFREGRIERALRRALPLIDDVPRGSAPGGGFALPFNDIFYSLRNILGNVKGPASLWLDPNNIRQQLEAEYRKQAVEATKRGDYRRAAFIYGKLLQDYRSAANALSQGGLHHDAAIVYLIKCRDTLAAARSFEAGSEMDRALQLYRQRGDHELAGDLLRRAGEEEQAVAEYQLAAARLIASGQGHYQAGELMLNRAKRPDLALEHYQAGWSMRTWGNAVPCAIRMAQIHTRNESPDKVLAVVHEADLFFVDPGNDGPAMEFYNEIATLADQVGRIANPSHANYRDDLRDRALMGIAGKIRQRVERQSNPGNLASTLSRASAWPPAVVSDAQFAVQSAIKRMRAVTTPAFAPTVYRTNTSGATTIYRGKIPVVTAICHAPESGDIFMGFASGEVVCLKPFRDEVISLPQNDDAVLALASNYQGDMLAVLRAGIADAGNGYVSAFYRTDDMYRCDASQHVKDIGPDPWLAACAGVDDDPLVICVKTGERIDFLRTPALLPIHHLGMPDTLLPSMVLLLPSFVLDGRQVAALSFTSHGELIYHSNHRDPEHYNQRLLGWAPALPKQSTLRSPSLAWLRKGQEGLELAAIGSDGNVYWSDLSFENGFLSKITTRNTTGSEQYLATTIVRPGQLAAVASKRIHWMMRVNNSLHLRSTTTISLPDAIAAIPYHRSNELIVVGSEGNVVRVPMPG